MRYCCCLPICLHLTSRQQTFEWPSTQVVKPRKYLGTVTHCKYLPQKSVLETARQVLTWLLVKVKGKFRPTRGHKCPEGKYRYSAILSLTSALDVGGWLTSRPGRFTPRKETGYPLNRRLGGPQDRCRQMRNISPPPEFDPRTVYPVASCYTDWAIPTMTHLPPTSVADTWIQTGQFDHNQVRPKGREQALCYSCPHLRQQLWHFWTTSERGGREKTILYLETTFVKRLYIFLAPRTTKRTKDTGFLLYIIQRLVSLELAWLTVCPLSKKASSTTWTGRRWWAHC
jgi:hypothetical protein